MVRITDLPTQEVFEDSPTKWSYPQVPTRNWSFTSEPKGMPMLLLSIKMGLHKMRPVYAMDFSLVKSQHLGDYWMILIGNSGCKSIRKPANAILPGLKALPMERQGKIDDLDTCSIQNDRLYC